MNSDKILLKAKVSIILNHPFFSSIMLKREIIAEPSIPTADTNGVRIRYNPTYVESLPLDEVVFLLAHEVMHIANLHHVRRNGRNFNKWNYACDYAINPILVNAGLKINPNWLLDEKYYGMSAEQIYDLLPDDFDKDSKGNDLFPSCGEVEDAPAQTQSELDRIESQTKQEVAIAKQIAKSQCKLPQELDRMVEELMQPKIAWREQLARFLTEVVKDDYSFSKPNTRYLHSGFILPSLYSLAIGDIVFMVDTSGSVNNEQLNEVAGEMQDICSMFKSTILVLFVDTKVAGVQEIEPDDYVRLEAKGGGGTDFRPGFDYLKKHNIEPKAVVYFTDGYCDDFPEVPDMPVLWTIHGYNRNFHPPFGEVLQLDSHF